MRMVHCYDCGKQYDYDEDGFCPRCGAFNQPAKKESAVRTYSEAAPSRREKASAGKGSGQLQQELGKNLKQMEQAIQKMLGSSSGGGTRLPGGHL